MSEIDSKEVTNKEKEDVTNGSKLTPSEDKTLQFQIITQDSGSRDIKESDISKVEDSLEFNKFQDDLELANFETRSVKEDLEPWKHQGPWYHDTTKKRLLIFTIIGGLLVIVIIVVPVTVAHAIKVNNG